jgi:hypothetical protein
VQGYIKKVVAKLIDNKNTMPRSPRMYKKVVAT